MGRVSEVAVRRQRTIQTTLILIILATIPCYCVGFVLLGVAPQRGARTPTPVVTQKAGTSSTDQAIPTLFPSITPYPTLVESTLSPLRATPTQIRIFPQYTLTFTPIPPTRTPSPTPIIIIPTNTPIIVPTSTPRPPTTTPAPPTSTPVPPTSTPIPPTATLTDTPIPPTATFTETPTNTPSDAPTP
jgi:hypothetical protein